MSQGLIDRGGRNIKRRRRRAGERKRKRERERDTKSEMKKMRGVQFPEKRSQRGPVCRNWFEGSVFIRAAVKPPSPSLSPSVEAEGRQEGWHISPNACGIFM